MPAPAAVPGRERAWTQASERELVRAREPAAVPEQALVRESGPEQALAAKESGPGADSG